MLTFTLRTVLAATLVADRRIVTEHVGWAESVPTGRWKPISLVADALDLLVMALPADLRQTTATAQVGLAAFGQPPATALPHHGPRGPGPPGASYRVAAHYDMVLVHSSHASMRDPLAAPRTPALPRSTHT